MSKISKGVVVVSFYHSTLVTKVPKMVKTHFCFPIGPKLKTVESLLFCMSGYQLFLSTIIGPIVPIASEGYF